MYRFSLIISSIILFRLRFFLRGLLGIGICIGWFICRL